VGRMTNVFRFNGFGFFEYNRRIDLRGNHNYISIGYLNARTLYDSICFFLNRIVFTAHTHQDKDTPRFIREPPYPYT